MNKTQAQSLMVLNQQIQSSPIYYVRDLIGQTPWRKQEQILLGIRDHNTTTVRSCHNSGKSWIAARSALWFLNAWMNSIVITTAPTHRQVENILWREIHSTYYASKYDIGGRLLNTELDVAPEWYAIGVSTKNPDFLSGFHASSGHILVIIDEAAGYPQEMYEAIEGILSSHGARLLLIGNPTSLAGVFYDSHHRDPTSHKIHISCFDTPNFTNNGIRNLNDLNQIDEKDIEIASPYLITPQWVKSRARLWGVDSPMFQSRCLGNFPSAEVNTLIPLNFIEAAMTPERRREVPRGGKKVGVDVARYGVDTTVICIRYGNYVDEFLKSRKEPTTATAGRVKAIHSAEFYGIDDIGLGGGVTDMLIEDNVENVVGVVVSSKAHDPEFYDLRSELYWHLAELFKNGQIALPNDEELAAQLASMRYEYTRRGIKVEGKDELSKRLGRSPDEADALAISFADFTTKGAGEHVTSGKSVEEMYNETRNY